GRTPSSWTPSCLSGRLPPPVARPPPGDRLVIPILLRCRYGSNPVSKTECLTLRFLVFRLINEKSALGWNRRTDSDAHALRPLPGARPAGPVALGEHASRHADGRLPAQRRLRGALRRSGRGPGLDRPHGGEERADGHGRAALRPPGGRRDLRVRASPGPLQPAAVP